MLIKIDIQRVCFFAWAAVIGPEFVCSVHSKTRQSEASEFRAEEGLLQGLSKENGHVIPKISELPNNFQGRLFKGIIWLRAAGCMAPF